MTVTLAELESGAVPAGSTAAEVNAMFINNVDELTRADSARKAEKSPDVSRPRRKPVIRADIIFDTEEDQKLWHAFLRELRAKYPELRTIGARVARFLTDRKGGCA